MWCNRIINSVAKRKRENGFTLLETLIGLVILAYIIMGMLRFFILSTVSTKQSEFATLATNYAREKMEDLANRNFDLLPTGAWTPDVWVPGEQTQDALGQKQQLVFTREIKVNYMTTAGGVLVTSVPATDLKKIDVRVTWTEKGSSKEITISTLMARHL